MTAAIGLITIGGLLTVSALKGISILDLLRGVAGDPLDPKGGGFTGGGTASTPQPTGSANATGTPKNIIDTIVLPLARAHGINVTPASVANANARHGATVTGTRSDHQGPPSVAWAADMSNGTTTPEEDALAADLARRFDIPWDGSGLSNATHNGYRFQLIYRTLEGGNHFNHVHFGVKVVGPHSTAAAGTGVTTGANGEARPG